MAGRYALIIANDTYEHTGLQQLRAPMDDAEALRGVLADPRIGAFQVCIVRNQASHVIRREIADFFADRKPDDLLLVHFSCHGLKNAEGELYLAAADTLPSRLSATAIPAHFVNQEMTDSRARRIVLLLDCCYRGAFSRGMRARAADTVDVKDSFPLSAGGGRGRVVITASSAMEYAFEEDRFSDTGERTPSVFTGALVRGLTTGEADADQDGLVDLQELYAYVHDRVRASEARQTPSAWSSNVQGKLVIAWAPPGARIVAAQLTDELSEGALDPLPENRLATVMRLRRLLLDEDKERAVGALDLLRRLSGDDSKRVAAAAEAAVEEAQLKAVPGQLDIGQVSRDSAPSSHTMRLVGSPLAHVFHATTTTRWVRVEQPEEPHVPGASVRVTVDTAALPEAGGELRGSITVTNRLGEFAIPVTGQVAGTTPRMPLALPTAPWARDSRLLSLAAVLAWLIALSNEESLSLSGPLGFSHQVVSMAVLGTGLFLMMRGGLRRTVGLALVAAGTVVLLRSGFAAIYARPVTLSWLLFLTVVLFASLLTVRLWPFSGVPRRLKLRTSAQRPLAYLAMAAAAMHLLMPFTTIPGSDVTIGDVVGTPSVLISVLPMAGLCVATALSGVENEAQRVFVRVTVAAYLVPELYLMLGSLLLGPTYTYLGDDVYSSTGVPNWYVLLRAGIIFGILTLALLLTRRQAVRA